MKMIKVNWSLQVLELMGTAKKRQETTKHNKGDKIQTQRLKIQDTKD